MIKLTSFYPFAGLTRVTHEFYEDKFVVTQKSLTAEREEEYTYSKVAKITDSYISSGSQMIFGFLLLFVVGMLSNFFDSKISGNTFLLQTARILFIGAILIFFTGMIKSWFIFFLDEDNNVLAGIKQTHKNRDVILQVTKMIAGKSESAQEFTVTDPFPKTKPKFEFSYYDFSNFQKTINQFYEKEIIGYQKDFLFEKVYSVELSTLNGKMYKGKRSIIILLQLMLLMIPVLSIMFGVDGIFHQLPRVVITYSTYIFLAAIVLSILLTFVKRDVIGFYNKSGNVAYRAYVNRADKEKFEKIVEFVQSRIPAENKETLLKE